MIRKHGVIDQGKDRKRVSKIKWTYREYHVQDHADVANKYVKMYCDTNKFPPLPFCGSHPDPYEARGYISSDPNIGHGMWLIAHIP